MNSTMVSNGAGAPAFQLEAKHALAQLAVTGCFNSTFYASAESQLEEVLKWTRQVEPEFVAKVAVYARQSGFMKDMPAALMVYLTTVDIKLAERVFPKVIDNGKMFRNFIQILRSGTFGRKNASSTVIQRIVQKWFDDRTDANLFWASTGSNPTFGQILQLAHPKPNTIERSALFAWLLDREKGKFRGTEFDVQSHLPQMVKAYEAFRKNPEGEIPEIPFEMITGLPLTVEGWKTLARRATWNQTLQTLNTFARHDVFKDAELVTLIADRIRNREQIQKAKAFPYRLMMAYKAVVEQAVGYYGRPSPSNEVNVPDAIGEALRDAMEVACENIPALQGNVVFCTDVSGSMSSPVTGTRVNPKTGKVEQHTTKVRCVDVAALISAAAFRRNPQVEVIPFDTNAHGGFKLNPRDSIMANANKLAAFGGGATNCAAPLALLNKRRAPVDHVVFVSDYESWAHPYGSRSTPMLQEWDALKLRCPEAKLTCIDLVPHATSQVTPKADILQVGGFSDKVFEVVSEFAKGSGKDFWVNKIEQVEL